ncbi:MAG: hypothetical protein K2H52_09200 [Lachnospiraceae bacterium]|nr:hypothetical protein [Lachnospiraceae bacterium]MDE6184345.1 hypothetical protein [Lachnospiraceae bacterium]MDE7286418.1 hypothetical protein [Lachnospiraceae bacterium]
MKKMTKKVLAVVATMAIMCMTLTGCGSKMAPADQTVSALFELAAKSNAAPMKDLLGFASEEDVRSAFFEEGANTELVDELSSQLTSAGVNLSDEELQEITDSMMAVLDKINYTTEITSESSDQVTVSLKIYGYSLDDMNQVMIDASTTMMNSITEEDQLAVAGGDTEVLTKYMQQYISDFLAGLSAMELKTEPVDVTVVCEKLAVDVSGKETVAWLPSDMNTFSSQIDAAMFQ